MTDRTPQDELTLCRTVDDALCIETFRLDQRRMAQLFGMDVRTVKRPVHQQYDRFHVRHDRELEGHFEAEVKRIELKRARRTKEEL